jgi:peroxiredoxin Q/BCP
MLKPGDPAPDFALLSQTGEVVRLSAYRGRQNVVLFFYPKDNTPVCTRETCAFRDQFDDFASQGTAVLGISADSIESHARFGARHQVQFPLLTDKGGAVRRSYGVEGLLGLLPGRATFVIDRDGIIRNAFSSMLQAEKHVRTALESLQHVQK